MGMMTAALLLPILSLGIDLEHQVNAEVNKTQLEISLQQLETENKIRASLLNRDLEYTKFSNDFGVDMHEEPYYFDEIVLDSSNEVDYDSNPEALINRNLSGDSEGYK